MIQEAAREFRELIDEVAGIGCFVITEGYGGLGLGADEDCLVAEQLSQSDRTGAHHGDFHG
jgi:alkylation response protein AidB-like acyl-CoA dehydrogenase